MSAQLATLATACDDYAAQVDEKRAEIRALVEEILAMVVEGIVISAAIGLLTGGAGAVAGGSAVVAKVAAQSPRFAAILAALRSVAAASSAYLRTARASLRASRAKLGKFADARLAMRTEAGQVSWSRRADGLAPASRTFAEPHHRYACRRSRIERCSQRMRDEPRDHEARRRFPIERRPSAPSARCSMSDAVPMDEWLAGAKAETASRRHSSTGSWAAVLNTGGTLSDVSGVTSHPGAR